jgi:hypothetical protein
MGKVITPVNKKISVDKTKNWRQKQLYSEEIPEKVQSFEEAIIKAKLDKT